MEKRLSIDLPNYSVSSTSLLAFNIVMILAGSFSTILAKGMGQATP
jgi:hypothetical protein